MKHLELVYFGDKLPQVYELIVDQYLKRLQTDYKITQKNLNQNASDIKKDTLTLNEYFTKNKSANFFALSEWGKQYKSEDFSNLIENGEQASNKFIFVVANSWGFEFDKVEKGIKLISLGLHTMPHHMAKLVLIEQIYRAEMIRRGTSYHY